MCSFYVWLEWGIYGKIIWKAVNDWRAARSWTSSCPVHGRGRLVPGLFHKAKSLILPDEGESLIANWRFYVWWMRGLRELVSSCLFVSFRFKKSLFCLKLTAISLLAAFAVDILCRATGTSVCSISARNYDYSFCHGEGHTTSWVC